MKLSVIIPTFNRCEILAQCLSKLFGQDFPPDDYEVVVAVDGSNDGTLEMLHSLNPACTLQVIAGSHSGKTAALNAGAKAARGHLLLFLDDDLLCDRALVREHVAAHAGENPTLAFGPMLVTPDSPRSIVTEWLRVHLDGYFARLAGQPDLPWHSACAGPNCSLPRSTFMDSGGYDELLLPRRLEDIELGLRLWKMGLRFRYAPGALAYHIGTKSSDHIVRIDARRDGKSLVALCRKHPDYRAHTWLAGLLNKNALGRTGYQLAARFPVSPEPFLDVLCRVAERFARFGLVFRTGTRLLGIRVAIETLRAVHAELGSWSTLTDWFCRRLPVLLYHRVGSSQPRAGDPALTICRKKFERQVRWLAARGYVGIRPSDWLAWCREAKPLPRKPVLLTFDDAYADIVEHALPVLRKYDFGAAVYVITKKIGEVAGWDGARLMTARQIKEWADQGVEFGGHSRTHPDLTTLTKVELEDEITGSAKDLADILGKRPVSFAYPYGAYDQHARECSQNAFDLSLTCDEGLNELLTNPGLLRRTMVSPGDSLIDLECRVRWGRLPLQRLRSRLRIRSRMRLWLQPFKLRHS